MKKILGLYSSPRPHWVGDGCPVRSIFSHASHGDHVSPFLLLDYAGPAEFPPANAPRGVGQHPHRGFETVTIVYQGEVEHRDSTGKGGLIGPGDVQWMTAASGILHEEFHSREFTRKGGILEMVQLWVNLPARDKGASPGYQSLLNREIPEIALADGAGSLRVIAGAFAGRKGRPGPSRRSTSGTCVSSKASGQRSTSRRDTPLASSFSAAGCASMTPRMPWTRNSFCSTARPAP
jgi:redox-sensitive bicupin YhaK (pirin superfamily)